MSLPLFGSHPIVAVDKHLHMLGKPSLCHDMDYAKIFILEVIVDMQALAPGGVDIGKSLRIPPERDHLFRLIVTAHSGRT